MGDVRLTHVDEGGAAHMVDVGQKAVTRRVARAGARVWMAKRTFELLSEQALPKGDVLAVARVAGIMAAKKTSDLIPLCHPLSLNQVEIEFVLVPEEPRIDIVCAARTDGKTGVEMEAIVGAAIAAVTIYDMCKAVDRSMLIGDVRLLEKTGGKEDYRRDGEEEEPVRDDESVDSTPAPHDPDELLTREGTIISVNVSASKGERKKSVDCVTMVMEHGIEGDAHAGPWHRQISLLADESIDKMVAKGLDVGPGDFAENITTRGIDLVTLPIGTKLELGDTLVQVTQIGKICHDHCAIFRQAGDCVMPREGIFVRVLSGGRVEPGDRVRVVAGPSLDDEAGRAGGAEGAPQ